jgi:hypothetical protein
MGPGRRQEDEAEEEMTAGSSHQAAGKGAQAYFHIFLLLY